MTARGTGAAGTTAAPAVGVGHCLAAGGGVEER